MPEENKELVPVEQEGGKFSIIRSPSSSFLNPVVYMQAKYIARDMMNDGALPKGFTSAGQAVMAMQAGSMMDLNWVESLQSLYFVNGSINIWGKAVPNRLRKHGYKFAFIEEDQTHCKARVWKEESVELPAEKGKEPELKKEIVEEYIEDFKFEDARKSGYTAGASGLKIGWKEGINRQKKLRYNVLSLIISTYIPDVLGPVAGIVEVSQDYAPTEKSEMAQTIESALKNRKVKKATMVEALPDFDQAKVEPKYPYGDRDVTEEQFNKGFASDDGVEVVAEIHIESDGDKTVEATTITDDRPKLFDGTQAEAESMTEVKVEETPSDGTLDRPHPTLEETIEKAKNYKTEKKDEVITARD